MFNKIVLLAVFSILQLTRVYSQTPSYYHYTSNDGLASSTVYQIIQDQIGFIWFATSNGISRFDGKHFTTYRTTEGLNSNSVISLAAGNKGEIYIGTYEKGINVFRNEKIENYCSTIAGENFALSYLLLAPSEKEGQKLFAYRSWGSLNIMHEQSSGSRHDYSMKPYPQNLVKLVKLPDGELIALTTDGLYNFKNDRFTRLSITGLPETPVLCLTAGDEGSIFIGTKEMIYRIKNDQVIERYKLNITVGKNITSIFKDKNRNLWFSVMNKGFFLIPYGSDQPIDIGIKMDLQNTLVNNYLEDNEGNIWISTFGKGVYCLNNLYIKSYDEKDGLSNNNVYSIAKEKSGKLLIGTFNGINVLEDGRFLPIKSISEKTLTENINSIHVINNDFYICGSFGGNDILTASYKGIKLHLLQQAAFCKTGDGLYLFGNWGNAIGFQRELKSKKKGLPLFYIFGDSATINRINGIFEDTKKNVWVGTVLGLCKLSNFSEQKGKAVYEKRFFSSNPVLNSRIKTIFQDDKNKVWFAGEKGIACYNLLTDSISTHTAIMGYDLSSSTSIASDSRKRIWIGNMKGLYLLDGKSIQHLNRQTGLPSDEVYSLLYDEVKNQLCIGTSNGISFLDISLFDNYSPPIPDVRIISIRAGDSVYTSSDHLVFEPEQHNVSVDFKALTFSSPGSVKYKYKLDDDEWVETENDFLNFISLKHGKYELQIMAKSQNSDWGKPEQLNFKVRPRYNETTWFKFLRIVFIVLVSVSFVTWRLKLKNKKIREESELTERINELKHQALSSMMNPHFIFNALNSVQYLINCHRNEEANDYIAMMAKLIRKNLDTAGNGFILLSEEIFRLKLYLDLEKLRFQDNFSYEIITGSDVDPGSVLIPNMIIQPFVENTLWHGIINSGRKGLVTISFLFEDVDIDSVLCRSLIIKVTDNGIGITEARKHKKQDHSSKGIQIIEERLRLLSTKMCLPVPIMFDDLSKRNGSSYGTEVIISLPSPLYKSIISESDSPSSLTA